MGKVAVVGVGQLPFKSRYADKTHRALAVEATKEALDDAGLDRGDIDSVVYSIYSEVMLRQQMADIYLQDYLDLNGKPSLRVSAGAATGGHAFRAAYAEIASGLAEVVLLLGVQKGQDFYDFTTRSRGDGLLKGFAISSDTTWLSPLRAGTPGYFAMILNAHIQQHGSPTPEQMARVAVKNHRNALRNPHAQLKVDLTAADVMNSRIIAWPVTFYEACLYSDGAAALILASEERARAITDKPVWVAGLASSDYATHRWEPQNLGRMMSVHGATSKAYAMAGIKEPLKELDVIELHDLAAGVEILTYEELGLAEPGQGGRLVDDGLTEMGGLLPVNPSGGRIACGHVAAVSEVYSLGSVTKQLREEAGPIQVPIRHGRGLVEDICGVASFADVIVLQR